MDFAILECTSTLHKEWCQSLNLLKNRLIIDQKCKIQLRSVDKKSLLRARTAYNNLRI